MQAETILLSLPRPTTLTRSSINNGRQGVNTLVFTDGKLGSSRLPSFRLDQSFRLTRHMRKDELPFEMDRLPHCLQPSTGHPTRHEVRGQCKKLAVTVNSSPLDILGRHSNSPPTQEDVLQESQDPCRTPAVVAQPGLSIPECLRRMVLGSPTLATDRPISCHLTEQPLQRLSQCSN